MILGCPKTSNRWNVKSCSVEWILKSLFCPWTKTRELETVVVTQRNMQAFASQRDWIARGPDSREETWRCKHAKNKLARRSKSICTERENTRTYTDTKTVSGFQSNYTEKNKKLHTPTKNDWPALCWIQVAASTRSRIEDGSPAHEKVGPQSHKIAILPEHARTQ